MMCVATIAPLTPRHTAPRHALVERDDQALSETSKSCDELLLAVAAHISRLLFL